MSKTIKQYSVTADRETGEWLETPEFVGKVSMDEWNAKQDTDAVHFDTYEENDQTRAIEVVWVS